jgi:hypothetical protein
MATGIAQFELDKYRFPNAVLNHLLIKLYRIRLIIRRSLLFLENKPKLTSREISITLTDEFEKSAVRFREHGWAFVENIFSEDVHNLLVKEWPRRYHFRPVTNIYKSYDIDFISRDMTFRKHPIIKQLEKYLGSDSLARRLGDFAADSVSRRRMGKVTFARARYGSSCVNHLDSVSLSEINKNASINMIFYIKGTGGARSGGTCIYRDKNGGVLFEPTNTTNSCLIYRSDGLYHGFPPMKFGTYRWTAACHAQVRS